MKMQLVLGEAMLLDMVLMPSGVDRDVMERYRERYGAYREALAAVLLSSVKQPDELCERFWELEEKDVNHAAFLEIAMMTPIHHVRGGKMIGLDLKRKLYRVLYGGDISDDDLNRLFTASGSPRPDAAADRAAD